MRLIVAILFFFLSPICSNAQNLQWAQNYVDPRSGGTDQAADIITDSKGNVFVTGFGTGINGKDYVTLKYSPSGVLLWSALADGINKLDDKASSIAVDNSGNVYVTGYTMISSSNTDFMTIKYDTNGVKQWEAIYNGSASQQDYAIDIKVDSTGVYVAGHGYQTGTSTSKDYVLVKYNLNGQQQWVRTYHVKAETVTQMAIDKSSNIYIAGYESGSGDANFLTLKYDKSGNLKWARSYSGSGTFTDYANAICVDNNENVYVTGSVQNTGSVDFATVKYDSSGTQKWVAVYDNAFKGADRAYSIVADNAGSVYVAGYSYVSPTTDCITLKYDSSGVQKWEATYSPTGKFGFNDFNADICLDKNNDVYITGFSFINSSSANGHIVKYDDVSGGQFWAAQYNGKGNGYDESVAITTDAAGNVMITGFGLGSYGFDEFITVKYNNGGLLVWDRTYSEPGDQFDIIGAAVIDSKEDIYVPAEIGGTITVMKYGANGVEKWAKFYTITGSSNDNATNACLTNDGVVVGGNSQIAKYEPHLVKYDSTGAKVWSVKYSSSSVDASTVCIASDRFGNFYSGGRVGNGTAEDYLLIKYNGMGVQKWVKTFDGAANTDYIVKVVTDVFGNVCVVGSSRNSSGLWDNIVVKYDSLGTFLWKYAFSTMSNSSSATDIQVDDSANVYFASEMINTNFKSECVFIKLKASGVKQWESHYTAYTSSGMNYLVLDSLSNSYILAHGSNGNGTKVLMLKYNNQGSLIWDVIVPNGSRNITVDRWGMPYIAADTTGYTLGDPADGLVQKYDQLGTLQWRALYKGKVKGENWFGNVTVSPNGSVVVTGREQFELPKNGGYNMHIVTAKYSNSNTTVGMFEPKISSVGGKVRVYPNPATSEVTFDLTEAVGREKLEIFDLTGRNVLEKETKADIFRLNCEMLGSGLYFYRLTGKESNPVSGKFAIE